MATSDGNFSESPKVCRCAVRGHGRPTPEEPHGPLAGLYIDDSACDLHRSPIVGLMEDTRRFVRSVVSHAGTSSALPCGCDAVKGVLCERASRLRDQAEAYLSRPAIPENWQRYERLRVWLTRHFEEGK